MNPAPHCRLYLITPPRFDAAAFPILLAEALDAGESRRWTEVIQFTINMEHVGDIVERGLLDVAERKIRHGLSFSDAGIAEITDRVRLLHAVGNAHQPPSFLVALPGVAIGSLQGGLQRSMSARGSLRKRIPAAGS